MADKSIGDLNFAPGTVDDSNTLFVVQQAGAAYKLSGHEFILAMTSVLDGHGGINSIVYTPPASGSLTGTMVITLADQSTTSVSVQNGKGIVSIAKTGTSGLVDTYTITYNDSTTSTFTVTNGAKGDTGDAWYVWIRYAGNCTGNPPYPASDSDIGINPDNWIGIYSGTSSTAPTDRFQYAWFEIKGAKGDTGDSITSVVRTSGTGAAGTTDTYTVYAEGTAVGTFDVYNGSNGEGAPSTDLPLMDGVATVGVSLEFARGDHIHPNDTSKQALINASGILKGAGNGSVSAATKGTDYGALSFTVSLTVVGWSNKAQTVSNSNFVTSGYAYIVSPASASFLDYGTAQIYADDVTTNGQMTFHCEDVPSSALTVNITRVVSA